MNWRAFPLIANVLAGTMAIAVSQIAAYPKMTFAAGLLCYAAAAYVAVNWIKRIRYVRERPWLRS